MLNKTSEGQIVDSLLPIRNATFTSIEVQLALAEGYTIENLSILDEFSSSERIFTHKLQSEDHEGLTDDQLDALIRRYSDELSITLDRDEMRAPKNPGLRSISKPPCGDGCRSWITRSTCCRRSNECCPRQRRVRLLQMGWGGPLRL